MAVDIIDTCSLVNNWPVAACPPAESVRITEDGRTRITEDSLTRITE